jgi:hypothetical protein
MDDNTNNLDPRIEILWLKYLETNSCPKCGLWDTDIRLMTVPGYPIKFWRFHCNHCQQQWADPKAQRRYPKKWRIKIK